MDTRLPMPINYALLEDEYDELPTVEYIRVSNKSEEDFAKESHKRKLVRDASHKEYKFDKVTP